MSHESTVADKPIAEKETISADKPIASDKPIAFDKPAIEDNDEAESFNPLGKIEGWSAFECASGPFGFRG